MRLKKCQSETNCYLQIVLVQALWKSYYNVTNSSIFRFWYFYSDVVIYSSPDWLIDWLIDWSIDWSIDWLILYFLVHKPITSFWLRSICKFFFLFWTRCLSCRGSRGFEQFSGFPWVFGAIDGCHIQIKTPSQHLQSYLNRLKSHSIILQVNNY